MVVVPEVMPLTMPLDEPMLAVPGKVLLQVPNGVPSVSVIVEDTHTVAGPDMATGEILMVTVFTAMHPRVLV
jgi:hypothetical protein